MPSIWALPPREELGKEVPSFKIKGQVLQEILGSLVLTVAKEIRLKCLGCLLSEG